MRIDWAALGVVSVVSVLTTLVFVLLLSLGIRLVSAGRLRAATGHSGTPTRQLGYAMLGLAGLFVLFGIWLIVPQFH